MWICILIDELLERFHVLFGFQEDCELLQYSNLENMCNVKFSEERWFV